MDSNLYSTLAGIGRYRLWVMGTTSAYARQGNVVIVHWPLPVWFGTSVTPSGEVVPMENHLHSSKYSAAASLKDIVLPELKLSCQVKKAVSETHSRKLDLSKVISGLVWKADACCCGNVESKTTAKS